MPSLKALYLTLLLFPSLLFAQTVVRTIDINPPSSFSHQLESELVHSGFRLLIKPVPLEQLKTELISARENRGKPLLIRCNLQTYTRLLHDPDIKPLLKELNIEFLNPHLVSTPLYLFGYAQNPSILAGRISKLDRVNIAFLTLPIPTIYQLEDADLINLLSQVLSRPKGSLKLYREREPYTAAKQLFGENYNLVGIYEDEPATLVDEFKINLEEELNAHALQSFPSKDVESVGQMHDVSPRLNYFVLQLQDQSAMIGAIPTAQNSDMPVLLGNLNSIGLWPAFSHALSDAYFLSVPEISKVRVEDDLSRLNLLSTYLLNAYLLDDQDRYKGLGFLGALLLLKDRRWSDAREKEIYEEKCALLQKQLKLPNISAKDILEWLGLPSSKIEKRNLFTDDVSRLYETALLKVQDASAGNRDMKKTKLEEARQLFIAALLLADTPKEVKGGRGLWSAPNYNPYYELGRVQLYLKQLTD